MPISAADAPKNLPKHAKEIYVSTWNSAYASTCKTRSDRDECASKIAWSAVKKKYKKKGETWVAKAAPATGSTSNLPHGPGSMFGATASRLGDEKKPKSKSCVCPKCGAKKTAKSCPDTKCPKCETKMKSAATKKSVSIKALGDGKLGGYLVRWGSIDERDLYDEWFTEKTDFWLDKWSRRPLIYQHGLDHTGTLKGIDAVVGVVDEYELDEIGLWIVAQLDLRHRYKEAIMHLVDEHALNLSSGALPRFVERTADGFIKTWPIVEVTLSPVPAEFRLADVVQVKAAYEAIGVDFDDKEVNMEERTIWEKFGERLGFIKTDTDDEEVTEEVTTEEMDEATTDEATPTTQASPVLAEEDHEKDTEGEEKKSTSTSFPEVVVDEVVIKAISARVVTAMTGSLAEVIAPIQQELDELKAWREKVSGRLDAAEKSSEEKAAEWIAGLPPIVRVRASEVKATEGEVATESEMTKTPREKRTEEWSNVFTGIIDTALKRGETIESMAEV